MVHPFAWIAGSARKPGFWLFALLAVAAMIVLQVLGGPLKTAPAPAGIVSYELAGSLANTEAILSSWDAVARVYAGLNLGFDYLFVAAYVVAIGLGCVLVGEALGPRGRGLAAAGGLLAWAVLLAGVLDGIENYALIALLLGAGAGGLSALARYCAIPKFLIVLAALLYVVVGALVSAIGRGARTGNAA